MVFDNLSVLAGSIAASGALVGQAANGAGFVLGTNTLDLAPLTLGGNQLSDLGAGELVNVTLFVQSAPTVGTNVQFQIIQADDAALSVNVQVLVQTDAFPIANLPAGAIINMGLDQAAPYTPKRYIGVRFNNTGAIATFAAFAGVTKTVQTKSVLVKSGYAVV